MPHRGKSRSFLKEFITSEVHDLLYTVCKIEKSNYGICKKWEHVIDNQREMSKEKQTKYGSICEIRGEHKIIDIVKRDIKKLKN